VNTDIYLPVFRAVDEARSRGGAPVVAIDGRCGAGKSTLARLLAQRCGFGLIHADDFFLPPGMRTPARLNEPGGNIHYERLIEEALAPISGGAPFGYRAFDCSTMDYSPELRRVDPAAGVIVEGSYCMRPECLPFYGLRIFLDITPELQAARLLAREGEEGYARFVERWIQMEERYFAFYGVRENSDVVIRNL